MRKGDASTNSKRRAILAAAKTLTDILMAKPRDGCSRATEASNRLMFVAGVQGQNNPVRRYEISDPDWPDMTICLQFDRAPEHPMRRAISDLPSCVPSSPSIAITADPDLAARSAQINASVKVVNERNGHRSFSSGVGKPHPGGPK
jgi:hypothetical protein